MEPFTTTTLLTKKEYTRYLYRVIYKKPYYIIVTILGVILICCGIYMYLILAVLGDVLPVLAAGLFFILVPTINILIAIRNTFSNAALRHPITFIFSNDSIIVKGTTAEATYTWQHIVKVQEDVFYLVLYISKKAANFIKKDGLTREQISFIKSKITSK